MPLWIGSPTDVRQDDAARQALADTNDIAHYDQDTGITKVPHERWLQAQDFEATGWLRCWTGEHDDRNHEHAALFDGYRALGEDLGDVLEVGCGPFTQLQTIIRPGNQRHIKTVTLLDPLLSRYLSHPHCFYRSCQFLDLPTTFLPIQAETLQDREVYDTVISINVLEHVQDAQQVLDNIWQALRPGGTIVLGERAWDRYDPQELYDAGHPIRVTTRFLHAFRDRFRVQFKNGTYFIGVKPTLERGEG